MVTSIVLDLVGLLCCRFLSEDRKQKDCGKRNHSKLSSHDIVQSEFRCIVVRLNLFFFLEVFTLNEFFQIKGLEWISQKFSYQN